MPSSAFTAAPLTQSARWLAVVPLLCVALSAIYGWATVHPGMTPGRSACVVLLCGCIVALALPIRLAWTWRSPQPWLLAALVWQGIALAGWTVAREPGLLWWGERCAALLTALGVCAWCQGSDPLAKPRPIEPLLRALAGAGAMSLILAAMTPRDVAEQWPTGIDLPFGNPNFVVGGALPLMGLCIPFIRDVNWLVIAVCGLAAVVVLGTGIASGDACRAVWPGVAAMIGLALILRLPARSHGWIIGVGEATVLGVLVLLLAGLIPTPSDSPSTGYRVEVWRSALEASAQAPWLGTGPASSLIVLQEQAHSPFAWLHVPSYAEHAHQEYLQAVLDGGLINAVVLLVALLLVLAPLWRRRSEPACAALLIAWAGLLTQAMIESHLSQPGPLLLLAMLAGVTWAHTGTAVKAGRIPWREMAAIPIAALMFAQISREFSDGGSPTMIEFRANQRIAAAASDHLLAATEADAVRARLGDLDNWLTREAISLAKAKDFKKAEDLMRAHLARLPLDPDALDLGLRLRDRHAARGELPEAAALNLFLHEVSTRAAVVLAAVPPNSQTITRRTRYSELVKRIDQ